MLREVYSFCIFDQTHSDPNTQIYTRIYKDHSMIHNSESTHSIRKKDFHLISGGAGGRDTMWLFHKLN